MQSNTDEWMRYIMLDNPFFWQIAWFFFSLNQLCHVRRSSRPKLIYRIDQYANSRPPILFACWLFCPQRARVRVSTAGPYDIIYRQIGFCVKAATNAV